MKRDPDKDKNINPIGLLRQLGDVSLTLPDLFKKGITLPLEGKSLKKVVDSLDDIVEPLQARRFVNIGERFAQATKIIREYHAKDKMVSIAGLMLGHDVRNHLSAVIFNTLSSYYPLLEHDERKSPAFLNQWIPQLMHIKPFLSTMAYFASHGDRKELLHTIPLNQLVHLLRTIYNYNITVTPDSVSLPTGIRSDAYIALNQLVTNSLVYHYDNIPPQVNIDFEYSRSASGQLYEIIQVQDNGSGFADEHGTPLSHEKMRGYFGEFSTTGGGLGGQILDVYLELSNKNLPKVLRGKYYMDIISKVKNQDLIFYAHNDDIYASGSTNIGRLQLPITHVTPHIPHIEHGSIARILLPVDENTLQPLETAA